MTNQKISLPMVGDKPPPVVYVSFSAEININTTESLIARLNLRL